MAKKEKNQLTLLEAYLESFVGAALAVGGIAGVVFIGRMANKFFDHLLEENKK